MLDTLRLTVTHGGVIYPIFTLAQLRGVGVPEDAILAGVKADLGRQVDEAAERLRQRVTTPGTGQAMEYQEAQAQAFAALDAPATATAERYPMLAATIGLDTDPASGAPAADVLGVARAIKAAYDAWVAAGAAIRRARLTAKAAIAAAATPDAAVAAYDAAAWPVLG